MRIPQAILDTCYNPQIGNVYWGPFANDASFHMAIAIAFDDQDVYLLPISSCAKTRALFIKVDAYAVIDIDISLQNQLFQSSSNCSFVYCGLRNIFRISTSLFNHYLSDQTASSKLVLPQKFLISLFEAIDQSNTLAPRQQKFFMDSIQPFII